MRSIAIRARPFTGAATVVLGVLLVWLDQALHVAASPQGILSLEFAWSADRALAIVEAWSDAGLLGRAVQVQLVDCVFPLVYASFGAGLCLAADRRFARAGALAFAVAAFLDAVAENIPLGRLLFYGGTTDTEVGFASASATAKFGLLAVGLLATVLPPRRSP